MEGGKLVCKTGKFCHIQELKGGEMIEVRTWYESNFSWTRSKSKMHFWYLDKLQV